MRKILLLSSLLFLVFIFSNTGIKAQSQAPRAMAEWEELDAIVISWLNSSIVHPIYTEIVRHAKEEVKVYIMVKNMGDLSTARNQLLNASIELDDSIEFVLYEYDQLWVRDYGPITVYQNDVGAIEWVDWIYDRFDRMLDDEMNTFLSEQLNIPIQADPLNENQFVGASGNFVTDGLGTAFSSKEILHTNAAGFYPNHALTEADIDQIMKRTMNIDEYFFMETLPNDSIHHIDMHMKLVDEETILVSDFPVDQSDGPVLWKNIDSLIKNVPTYFGEEFNIIKLPMPTNFLGQYPNVNSSASKYFAYSNSIFINKTILVPTYGVDEDEMALEVYKTNFPGYKVEGIDCYSLIDFYGAIHCIVKEIGSRDPLWIALNPINDFGDNPEEGYFLETIIKHQSGIESAKVWYRLTGEIAYKSVDLTLDNPEEGRWTSYIPQQEDFSTIEYYVEATSVSGKTQVRPLPAPEAYLDFSVEGEVRITEITTPSVALLYPNPTRSQAVLKLACLQKEAIQINLKHQNGQEIRSFFKGKLESGEHEILLDTNELPSSIYWVEIKVGNQTYSQKLVIQ